MLTEVQKQKASEILQLLRERRAPVKEISMDIMITKVHEINMAHGCMSSKYYVSSNVVEYTKPQDNTNLTLSQVTF